MIYKQHHIYNALGAERAVLASEAKEKEGILEHKMLGLHGVEARPLGGG